MCADLCILQSYLVPNIHPTKPRETNQKGDNVNEPDRWLNFGKKSKFDKIEANLQWGFLFCIMKTQIEDLNMNSYDIQREFIHKIFRLVNNFKQSILRSRPIFAGIRIFWCFLQETTGNLAKNKYMCSKSSLPTFQVYFLPPHLTHAAI